MKTINEKFKNMKNLIFSSRKLIFSEDFSHFYILCIFITLDICFISLSYCNEFISFEMFLLWVVIFSLFLILLLLFRKKNLVLYLLYMIHGLAFLVALVILWPSTNKLNEGLCLFIGYWVCLLTQISNKSKLDSFSKIFFAIKIFIFMSEISLFFFLVAITDSNTFELTGILFLFLVQLIYIAINNKPIVNDIQNNKLLVSNTSPNEILLTNLSGCYCLLKVKPFYLDCESNIVNNKSDSYYYRTLEKYLELVFLNAKAKEMNICSLENTINFFLNEFEVQKILNQENIIPIQTFNNIQIPENDFEETNDRKKLLTKRNMLIASNQENFNPIFNFIRMIINRNCDNNAKRNNSVSLGFDQPVSFGKFICFGKTSEQQFRSAKNYVLTISEVINRGESEVFLLIELLERDLDESTKDLYKFKDQMLANVAHDLRSPINGILSFIELSKEAKTEEERLKNLEYAQISGNLLLNLVSDILDFSVIREGKLKIQIKPFILKELIDEVVNLMRLQAEMKQLQIKVDYQLDFSLILQSDRRRIMQLLINLLSNSIKFTNKGFIKLKISKTFYNNVIKFEIIDSGIGIKPEILPQLFKPFATFDTETGLNKYGIGLGLNICKMIVSLLGPSDSLFVSSIYHQGSKFGFLLFTNIQEKTANGIAESNSDQTYKSNVVFNEYTSFRLFKKLRKKKKPQHLTVVPTKRRISKEIIGGNRYKTYLNKREISSDSEILNKQNQNQSDSLTLRRFQSCSVGKALTMEERLNPFDHFSNYGSGQSFNLIDDIVENDSKKEILNESPYNSFIDKKAYSDVSLLQENNDEYASNESPLVRIGARQFQKINLMKKNSKRSERPSKNKKKKMISTQELDFFFKDEKSKKEDLNILIVDDNPFNILILTEYVKKIKGYKLNVLTACNGSVALEIYERENKPDSPNPINLILMDCQMPIYDGYETAKMIRDLINEQNFLPVFIIAITAFQDEKKCLDAGMNSFLMKPVSETEFLDAIYLFLNSNIS